MDEADKLIIDALRNLSCELEPDKKSLGQLSTEQLVQAVVLCIHAIDKSSQNRLTTKLPPGMSARFNFGTKLADECRGLGCPGDLGYQTFLYASEKEIRNILIFLIEKLPKQDESVSSGPESFLTRLKISVAGKVERDLKQDKPDESSNIATQDCEPFCGCVKCYPEVQAPNMFDLLPRETRNAAFGDLKKHSLLPSVMDTHAMLKANLGSMEKDLTHQQTKERVLSVMNAEFVVAKENDELEKKEHDHLEKPLMDTIFLSNSLPNKSESLIKNNEVPAPSVENEIKKKKMLMEQKQEKEDVIANKTSNYKEIRSAIMKHNKTIADLSLKKTEVDEILIKSNEEMEKHQKILQLLPDGEENLNKLINVVQKSKDRLEGLKKQWGNHKDPIEREYLKTIESIETMSALGTKGNRNKPSVLEKYEKVQNDIKEKEIQYRKLIKIADSIIEGETRDSYTKRILDILKQIEKLRNGIDGVIADVKCIQKDINMQNGKLERSYFEISMTMKSKMNNKDPYIEQSMMMNKQIHEVCFHTVETIRKTGALGRETRDLEEQVKSEEGKGLKAKIERLSADFRSLQSENKELAKQFKKNSLA